jgi:hypothetical protein
MPSTVQKIISELATRPGDLKVGDVVRLTQSGGTWRKLTYENQYLVLDVRYFNSRNASRRDYHRYEIYVINDLGDRYGANPDWFTKI